MINHLLISNLAALADNHDWACVKGSLEACIPVSNGNGSADLTEVGVVEMIVSRLGKYLVWHHDSETDTIRGIFDDGSGAEQRICMGDKVDYESKLAIITGISAEVINAEVSHER